MNLHEIPFKVMVTMPQCAARRWRLHEALCRYGISDVIAEHPIPLHDIKANEYPHLPQKALPYISQILTLKKIIADAKRRKASSLWLLEDDAVLHPEFLNRARRLRVPNNWRFLYLGGAYYEDVVRVNDALVRPNKILDLHCVVISSEMYDIIEDRFEAALHDRSKKEVFADVTLADLHSTFPAYLCRPNLSWQSSHQSDLNGRHYSSYKPDGDQWRTPSKPPVTAIYTLWTKNNAMWSGWPNKDAFVKSFMYSAYLAQNHFSRVVLYTDTSGKELLKNVYFDDVFVTLDKLDINPSIGSAAMLDTLVRQTEAFVHLQPEVFPESSLRVNDDRIIVHQGRISDAGLLEATDWLNKLEWKPNFVRESLGQRKKRETGVSGMLGGRDVEFFNWYGAICLGILRKPENAQYINSVDESNMNAVALAIEQLLISVCASYRGKRFCSSTQDHKGNDSNGRKSRSNPLVVSQLSNERRRSIEWVTEIDSLNAKAKLLPESSTPFIQYAKHGHGWYIDLQSVGYKVVTGSKQESGWQYLRSVFTKLGVMCEPHMPDRIENEISEHQVGILEQKRLAALLNVCAQAKKRGVEEFLILQNGTSFHEDIHNQIYRIRVPYDWRFLYLGGKSTGVEEFVSRGLIKSDCVLGLFALVIRQEMIEEIEGVLSTPLQQGESCESRIAALHTKYPAFLCAPQLANEVSSVTRPRSKLKANKLSIK